MLVAIDFAFLERGVQWGLMRLGLRQPRPGAHAVRERGSVTNPEYAAMSVTRSARLGSEGRAKILIAGAHG